MLILAPKAWNLYPIRDDQVDKAQNIVSHWSMDFDLGFTGTTRNRNDKERNDFEVTNENELARGLN